MVHILERLLVSCIANGGSDDLQTCHKLRFLECHFRSETTTIGVLVTCSASNKRAGDKLDLYKPAGDNFDPYEHT